MFVLRLRQTHGDLGSRNKWKFHVKRISIHFQRFLFPASAFPFETRKTKNISKQTKIKHVWRHRGNYRQKSFSICSSCFSESKNHSTSTQLLITSDGRALLKFKTDLDEKIKMFSPLWLRSKQDVKNKRILCASSGKFLANHFNASIN